MNSPRIQSIDTANTAEEMLEPSSQGTYKVFNRILDWITNDRTQLLNITDRINDLVKKSGIRDGIIHVQSLHTTTALFLNEWQDALLQDVKTPAWPTPPRSRGCSSGWCRASRALSGRSTPTTRGRWPSPTS